MSPSVDCMTCLVSTPGPRRLWDHHLQKEIPVSLDEDPDGDVTPIDDVTHRVEVRNTHGMGWTACGMQFHRTSDGVAEIRDDGWRDGEVW